MAIAITQAPSSPNGSHTYLVHAVSSNLSGSYQFQYVMDVVSGSQVLSRVKQYPNPEGVGIFDPHRILNDYLEYPTSFTLNGSTTNNSQVGTFQIRFGEEYGTSPSSSVTLYDGAGSPGAPSVTQGDLIVFPLSVDPNDGVSYNWNEYPIDGIRMSDRPNTIPVDCRFDTIYQTFYDQPGGTSPTITVQSLDIDGNVTSTSSTFTVTAPFTTFSIGRQSILSGYTPDVGVKVTMVSYGGSTTEVFTYPPAQDTGCNWERVNFMFINKYGFWDSYGVNLPQSKRTSIKRSEITTPFVNYSNSSSPYTSTRRGKKSYNLQYTDTYEIYTNWLNEEEAEWLSQMFESPEVYINKYEPNGVVVEEFPINILNTTYTHNTNRAAQKTFQFQIQYQFANQRLPR